MDISTKDFTYMQTRLHYTTKPNTEEKNNRRRSRKKNQNKIQHLCLCVFLCRNYVLDFGIGQTTVVSFLRCVLKLHWVELSKHALYIPWLNTVHPTWTMIQLHVCNRTVESVINRSSVSSSQLQNHWLPCFGRLCVIKVSHCSCEHQWRVWVKNYLQCVFQTCRCLKRPL